ncbi:MAG TPA: RsmE family RNA methyltransferase [Oligoflexia bacterium]|nr:RsmE family RNA methyltransferase [Oligoflexia bacterium]HMR24475.1 RsmE family RNA methyltransferase [Oligoflexia bacterium]
MFEAQTFRLHFETLNKDSSELGLDKNQAHWIKRVLRKNDGDTFEALNGNGGVAQVRLNGNACEVISFKQHTRKLCQMDFYIAMVALDKAKLIVEKLTEIGAASIHFVKSKRSNKILDEKKHKEKLEIKAIESIKQCGNPYLPKIYMHKSLSMLLNETAAQAYKFFLNENEIECYLSLPKLSSKESVIVSVGPEASWDRVEKQQFLDHGFESVSLGPNVLRVETAAIVAAAQVLALSNVNNSPENKK